MGAKMYLAKNILPVKYWSKPEHQQYTKSHELALNLVHFCSIHGEFLGNMPETESEVQYRVYFCTFAQVCEIDKHAIKVCIEFNR